MPWMLVAVIVEVVVGFNRTKNYPQKDPKMHPKRLGFGTPELGAVIEKYQDTAYVIATIFIRFQPEHYFIVKY